MGETQQEALKREIVSGDYVEKNFLVFFKVEPYIDSVLVCTSDINPDEVVYVKHFTFQEGFIWDYGTESFYVYKKLHVRKWTIFY